MENLELLRENNLLLKQIAKKLNIDLDNIYEKPEVKKLSLAEEVDILTKKGYSKNSIAKKLNVSTATVSNYRRMNREREKKLTREIEIKALEELGILESEYGYDDIELILGPGVNLGSCSDNI